MAYSDIPDVMIEQWNSSNRIAVLFRELDSTRISSLKQLNEIDDDITELDFMIKNHDQFRHSSQQAIRTNRKRWYSHRIQQLVDMLSFIPCKIIYQQLTTRKTRLEKLSARTNKYGCIQILSKEPVHAIFSRYLSKLRERIYPENRKRYIQSLFMTVPG